MANKPFQKFIEQKESGAEKKRAHKTRKKKIRQETKAYFEKKKAERRGGPIPVGNQESGVRSQEFGAGRENQHMSDVNVLEIENKEDRGAQRPPIQKRRCPKQTPPARQTANLPVRQPGNKPSTAAQPLNLKPQNPNKPGHTANAIESNSLLIAGICARRDAADLVKSGKVTVNGQKIVEPGFKVTNNDEI
jgi:23S rRNA pseudouridine2605 synthase